MESEMMLKRKNWIRSWGKLMLDTDNTTEFILCWGYSKIRYRKKHIFCSIQLPLKGDCVYACKDQGEIQIAVRV